MPLFTIHDNLVRQSRQLPLVAHADADLRLAGPCCLSIFQPVTQSVTCVRIVLHFVRNFFRSTSLHSKMLKVLLVLALVGAAVAQDCPISPATQALDFSAVATACEALLFGSRVTFQHHLLPEPAPTATKVTHN